MEEIHMNDIVIVNENDIDNRLYRLAHWCGFTDKSEAYREIREAGLTNCTTYYVQEKACWAIVVSR
jgi:hypothetical protein